VQRWPEWRLARQAWWGYAAPLRLLPGRAARPGRRRCPAPGSGPARLRPRRQPRLRHRPADPRLPGSGWSGLRRPAALPGQHRARQAEALAARKTRGTS